ncbi:hypothetical protein C2W62_09955 [Candidatus Entotheonella serta]|nr:hypothetical protein C2W62_09955 [Candidatus Entotheonella serta]
MGVQAVSNDSGIVESSFNQTPNAVIPNPPKVVFMFAGQGLEWAGMGRQLYATEPVFQQLIDDCEKILSTYVTWSLVEELHRDMPDNLFRKEVVQPTLFAVEVALAALWRSYGVEPQAVIGHSMGEIAAAYTAGALSLEDGVRLICKYDEIIEHVRGQGVMGMVNLGASDAAAVVEPFADKLYVGIHNTPTSTVLSGTMSALSQAFEQLQAQDIFCRQIHIDFAAHSPIIDPIVPRLQEAFAPVRPREAPISIYSVVTKSLTNGGDLDADYWTRMIQRPNYFSEMVELLLEDGFTTFIEISGHPILSKFAEEICSLRGKDVQVFYSLYRAKDEIDEFLSNVARINLSGVSINRPMDETLAQRLTALEPSQSESAKSCTPLPLPPDLTPEQSPSQVGIEHLATLIDNTIKQLFNLPTHTLIDRTQGFFEMGLDSLTTVRISHELAAQLGVSLPATVAFEYPTTMELAHYVLHDVLGLGAEELTGAQASVVSSSAGVAAHETIAIIGMACRFPGHADSPETFWQLLQNGQDGIVEVPPDRWDVDAYYDPTPGVPGKIYTRRGGFIGAVDGFDALFFQIAPREATYMDPQQRLLMEVSWEALENAGCPPDSMKGKSAGVFIAMSTDDYALHTLSQAAASEIDVYTNTGVTRSVSAGRLAYTFGWQGPTMQVDTACSSSLVAIHLACQSLRSGESELALAGGVNLILSPQMSIGFCKLNALSPDGMCRTFDANANGYVRGEGCGVIILKRLSDAVTAGDTILSVIPGSAINHDGASSGLTVPNGQAQQALLRQALHNANLSPTEISYVEAHGTGTPLGDPIEVRALSAVLCQDRPADNPLMIGSVKTNIGHLEAAAGMAGVIKVILALQHQTIPPHLHLNELNPNILWDTLPLSIPTSPTLWTTQPTSGTRIAGVSAFGISGTNAHILLAESPMTKQLLEEEAEDRPTYLLTLSAKSEPALLDLLQAYRHFFSTDPDMALSDICYTSHIGRSHFAHRVGLTAQSVEHMQTQLATFNIAAHSRPNQPPSEINVHFYDQ